MRTSLPIDFISPFGFPLVSLWFPFGFPLVSLWLPKAMSADFRSAKSRGNCMRGLRPLPHLVGGLRPPVWGLRPLDKAVWGFPRPREGAKGRSDRPLGVPTITSQLHYNYTTQQLLFSTPLLHSSTQALPLQNLCSPGTLVLDGRGLGGRNEGEGLQDHRADA